MSRLSRGFTLAEVMVSMLFVSIALFGYISLHMRIIHSSTTLQKRHAIRRKMDLNVALVQVSHKFGDGAISTDSQLLINGAVLQELQIPLRSSGDLPGNNHTGEITMRTLGDPAVRHYVVQIEWSNAHGNQTSVVDGYLPVVDKGW